ncbi:MAG: M16 family metallopeptidase, partial [Planctomycetota bacterium]
MPGGSRLVLVPDRSLPIVSVSATLLAGLRQEPAGKVGISAMLAKLMPKGTRARSGEQLAAEIEGRGGSFGVMSGRNSLSVRVQMLSRDLPTALEFAAEILSEPRLDAGDIEKVRTETLAAIRSRSEHAWGAAGELLAATLFKGHPYSTPETGTVKTVESITKRDLAAFHEHVARRGNLVLSIVGDFDAGRAAELARSAFGKLPAGELGEANPAPASTPAGQTRVEKALPGSRSAVVLWGFPGVRMGTKEAYALDIAAEAMAGMSGRLWNAVREDRGLAYAVGAYNAPQPDPGYFALY